VAGYGKVRMESSEDSSAGWSLTYVVRFTAACHHVPSFLKGPMRLTREIKPKMLTTIPTRPVVKMAQYPIFFFQSMRKESITGMGIANATRSVARLQVPTTSPGMTILSRVNFSRSTSQPLSKLELRYGKNDTPQVGTTDQYPMPKRMIAIQQVHRTHVTEPKIRMYIAKMLAFAKNIEGPYKTQDAAIRRK
jgi:hypothetical protein